MSKADVIRVSYISIPLKIVSREQVTPLNYSYASLNSGEL